MQWFRAPSERPSERSTYIIATALTLLGIAAMAILLFVRLSRI